MSQPDPRPSPLEYRFVVLGEARPHGVRMQSVQVPGKRPWIHKYTDRNLERWQASIRESAQKIYKGIMEGPVAVHFKAFLNRPKSRPKRFIYPDRKPDIDNLYKAAIDGVKGILIRDDNQVCLATLEKRYAQPHEAPRIELQILLLESQK